VLSRGRNQPSWWETALVAFGARAIVQLRKRFPSIATSHEDLVSEAVTDLTALMRRGHGPMTLASWYGNDPPPKQDAERFERLAFSILNRRVADHFRGEYKHWVESLEDHPEAEEHHSDDPALDEQLDLRRATHALLRLMAQLPPRDRAQLEEVALGGSSPMNERDRQRLRRLRASLLERLRHELGEDAMSLIRRI
jgi:DNA-directed RNA polymerase specialized sigma24 family protein